MNRKIVLHEDDIYTGNLILINRDYPLKKQYYSEKLVTYNLNFNMIQVNYRLREHLIDLLCEIKSGDKIIPTSGYRSLSEQTKLYEDSLLENGKTFTESYVALPNHSEHQSGLAIDLAINQDEIDLIRPSFPNIGISKDFKDRCTYYGFIERYQFKKEDITKINAEEWHFRYIGYPHSQIMKEKEFCLEEYIEFLQAYKREENPLIYKNYEISYLEYKGKDIEVILEENEEFSGNNVQGFIFTKERS